MKQIFSLIPALLLSACVAAPPTTPQVKEIAPETLGLGAADAPQFPDEWWKSFHDPQVDRLAGLLVEHNPTLAGAIARIRAAGAQAAVAGAEDLPQVTLDGQEQRELLSKDYIIPPPYGGTYRWFGQTQANLTWNLDFWGKQAALIGQARDSANAAMLDAQGARLALSGAFAQTYINLYLAYVDGDIADATVAERQEILDLTQNRFNAGLENASSVEQAKALLALAKVDQRSTEAQRDLDVHAIAALAGEGAALYSSIVRPTPDLDAALPLPENLPADLISRRPDILAARARVDAAAKGRQAAHAEFYPNIDLAAFAGFQAVGLSNLLSGNAFTMGVGPALHLPIFDAGKIRAQYAGATAGLDIAVADYNGAVVSAIKQTADAMTEVASLTARRADQQAALDSATRSFALAEERYKDGLSDQIPMLNAEATLLSARQQMAALVAETATERVTLLLSVGGGFNTSSISTIARQE
ncbi:MAG TPA: efflux transporter outer membrane subunit [Rhizomicrobium sp.]|nr:efflux transporter outer membrane subunit [Rhizomicrobium sp.]